MGIGASRDAQDQEQQQQHPMRFSRLGPRTSHSGPGLPPRSLLDSASLRDRFHEHPMLPLHPHDVSVVLHRSPVQRSGIVANVVNLDKTSLSVIPAADDPRVLLLQFNFSASVDGFLAVYYCARQMVHRGSGAKAPVRRVSYVPLEVPGEEEKENGDDEKENTKSDRNAVSVGAPKKEEEEETAKSACTATKAASVPAELKGQGEKARKKRKPIEKTKFGAGNALQYRQKRARGLRLDAYNEALLTDVVDGQYPIVIRIEARHPADSPVPKKARVVSQSTFAILTKSNSGEWGIKMVRQEVLVGGTIYVVEELYGIGAVDVTASRQEKRNDNNSKKSSTKSKGTDSDGKEIEEEIQKDVYSVDKSNECVICLTEPSNTAVLPCGHLCLCVDCGAKLSTDPSAERRRCPICRTDLESLLHILPTTLSSEKRTKKVEKRIKPAEATEIMDRNNGTDNNNNNGSGSSADGGERIKDKEEENIEAVELEALSSGDGEGDEIEIESLRVGVNEIMSTGADLLQPQTQERLGDRDADGPGSAKEPETLRVVYKVEDEASLSSEVSGGEEDGNITPVAPECKG